MVDKQSPPDAGSLLRTAARDKDLGFHLTASWADVQRKAKRIRAEGGVTIVIASGDGIGGQVKGDHGTYEAILVYRPGTRKVADYTCGCKWAAYAWDRSPAYRRFEGRKCSHALALQYEAQSQGMFGKEVSESEPPKRVTTIVSYDPDTGQNILARPYEGSLVAAMVAQLRAADEDPSEIVGGLVRAGMRHTAAVALYRAAEHHDEHHIEYSYEPYPGESEPLHSWHLRDRSGEPLSSLYARPGTGEIANVETPRQHQGNGYASRLYDHASRQMDIYHSPEHHRTPEGDRFARSVGGPTIDDDQAYSPDYEVRDEDQRHEAALTPESFAQNVMDEYHELRLATERKVIGPSVSGVALKAHDTGRILMIQRSLEDEKDPARGTWEIPGGHHENGDLTSLHAAIREWTEEVGQPFPDNGVVKHTWTSPNGIYQGHVVVIPSEKDLSMKDGRVTVNPDDPKGDAHEQAAWWDVDHAKKNPALRPELKGAPWKEIAKASLDGSKTASAWDPISNTNPQPGRGTSQPEHSNSTNPASTGWATSEDPDNWNNLNANQETLSLSPSMGFDSALHEHPEPALPVAYGEDLDPIPDDPPQQADLVPDQDGSISLLQGGSVTPNTFHSSLAPESSGERLAAIVADFQKSAAAQELMTPPDASGNEAIAAAAKAHLAKTALKSFDFAEQQELINEGAAEGNRARNLKDLRIEGTHYALIEAELEREGVDATGLFI
jgi:8-oxo-dGTP pyrophosphatase MutT (NUDIX family)